MKKERFKIGPYVSLILRKGNEILLIRRYQTEYHDGFYACAGGGVDGDEPITHAMIREAREEPGIILKPEHLRMVHILHGKHKPGFEAIGFFMEATEWEGKPRNMEPHKCDDIAWFTWDALPHNTIPHLKHVIQMVYKNVFYSEYGWE